VFIAVHSKIVALPSIMSPLLLFQGKIVVRCVKSNFRSVVLFPGSFALPAPELSVSILNYEIISLIPTIDGKDYIAKL
jgi:hypothetical protein